MTGEWQPTPSEVLDLMDRLERDKGRRAVLASSWAIYEAAVEESVVCQGAIDALARCMQDLHNEGLIAYRTRNAGTPESPVWDGSEIQQMHQWHVTAHGRRDAAVFREGGRRVGGVMTAPSHHVDVAGRAAHGETYDVFISHASEDKEGVARPLAGALKARGWSSWLDELHLSVGDSLSEQIDQALSSVARGPNGS